MILNGIMILFGIALIVAGVYRWDFAMFSYGLGLEFVAYVLYRLEVMQGDIEMLRERMGKP